MINLIEKIKEYARILDEIRNNSNFYIITQDALDVCNEKGSSLRSPKCPNCGSWKKHWEKLSRIKDPILCSNLDCCKTATVGGHVVFANAKTGPKFIIPLCESCNGISSDEIYTIRKGTIMVSANCKDTCDKLK